jgi:hypothetical protein
MVRKVRFDSASGAVAAMAAAAQPMPAIPSHIKLRSCDLPFWDAILHARTREEWTKVDLVLAAQLARGQADIEIEQQKIYDEGSVIQNDRGTSVTNPRLRAIGDLKSNQLAVMRALAMNASANADPRDLGKRRKVEAQAGIARQQVEEEDDLIPTT